MRGAERKACQDEPLGRRRARQPALIPRQPLERGLREPRRELRGQGELSLQSQRDLGVIGRRARPHLAADRQRLVDAAEQRERPHERARDVEARMRIGRGVICRAQVPQRAGPADADMALDHELGASQREQDGEALRRGRRLALGSLEIRASGGGRLRLHVARRGEQALHDPRVAAAIRGQQMRRERDVARTVSRKQSRGSLVARRPPAGRDLVVDRRAHDRVDELERAPAAQDRGGRQKVGRFGGASLVELGQRGGVAQLAARAEDGDGEGEIDRLRPELA